MRPRLRALALAVGTAAVLGGCGVAALNTESLLDRAGFRKLPADTPEKTGHLDTLPARTFVRRSQGGKSYYVYTDPSYCKCLYVGTPEQYARYQGLAQQQQAETEAVEAREEEVELAK
ncbi:MAG: hypothetical protein L0027_03180 [Candidatus Rokubacteria bacterium]|nr:hypothetical protein [Candidatus Rokubacteria bacterium]